MSKRRRRKLGKDAPCSSSRVIDPSCLFTTDEGESETKIRRTEQLKQQQSQYKHFSAELNPQETHSKKTSKNKLKSHKLRKDESRRLNSELKTQSQGLQTEKAVP